MIDPDDEIITISLQRSEAKVLKEMIREREAYNFFTNKIKTWWVWALAGGIITLIALWETLPHLFTDK